MKRLIFWCSLGLFALLLAQPVGAVAQTTTSIAVVGVMMLLLRLRQSPEARHVFVALGLVLVGRYVYWRATQTLPSPNDLVDFIPGIILFAAEMFSVLMLGLSLFVVSDPIDRAKPAPLSDEDLPSVDVLVPSYNEGSELLAATLAACRQLDYPADKLTVYLLDDGGTDQKCNAADPIAAAAAQARRAELQALCADLGVRYHARAFNTSAKAGNLNAGLDVSKGELIAVFDADHAPTRDFLRATVGHFREDPRLFLVQTPHFFLNPDPIEKNLSLFRRMPSENDMFYGLIQRGLDRWNAAFFCGSAAVLRRTALEETSGFSGKSVTEDAETALSLHARGWNSRYVDTPMIAGLQPETFASFIGQRSRWCTGMLQILILSNPLSHRGLSLPQKICYLSSAMFWLFPLSRLIFLVAPLLYVFFSVEIYKASLQDFAAYTLPYLGANLLMQNYLYGKVRWPWVSELYEYVQSVFLVRAIVGTVLSPSKPTFKVTQKGETLDEERLSELAPPYFALFGLLVSGMLVAFWRWTQEVDADGLLMVVGGWLLLNLVIAGLALGVVAERTERRRTQRLTVERSATLVINGERQPVVITDASTGGVGLRALSISGAGPLPVGTACTLELPCGNREPVVLPVRLRRKGGGEGGRGIAYGFSFEASGYAQAVAVADLMYGDAGALTRFRARSALRPSLAMTTLRILSWSLRQTLRGLAFAWRRLRGREAVAPGAAP